MVKINIDLDKDMKSMYYCKACERRMKLSARKKGQCPRCNGKLIHASQHAWRLVDALKDELTLRGLTFRLIEEVPLESKWDFMYHMDCGIWVVSENTEYNGVGVLVDLVPAKIDGRYEAKMDLAHDLRRFGIHVHTVTLKECSKVIVVTTARKIVNQLFRRGGFA